MISTFIRGRALVALLGALALASTSRAQSPDGDDTQQTVARVAYFSGQVSYSRGDDPDDWQPASVNVPMTLGDRLYTAKGSRLELQIEGGAIYLAPETDLAALNLTYEVKQFSLGIGSASLRIRRIDSGESYEIDTPNAAVTLDRAGEYRIDVDANGDTRVIVSRGSAHVAAAGGDVPLEARSLMTIDGIDSPVYDITALPRPDSWDQWVETRSRRSRENGSRRYVSANISGVEDLDEYGRWSQVPEYGTCWSPQNVSADWQPYRGGRWAWQDPWGWSWISNEPWGWAPYHYGRWVTSNARWYWVPVGPDTRSVRYAPALVAFVGGPGLSLSVSVGGGGYVGWFPLAPRDPFVPWWGSRAREASVTNVTYVNRTYVTIVNQNTFISGAPIAANTIRDATIVRQISVAPVVHGAIQVIPVASSIRVSAGVSSAPRPPAVALTRAVVTRLAPAPAPALFKEKANVIRENHGAPLDTAQSARLSPSSKAIQPTRSVTVEPGRVAFAPKNGKGSGPVPVPVTSTREGPPGQPSRQQDAARQTDVDARRKQDSDAAQKQESDAAAKRQQEQLDTRRKQDSDAAQKQASDAAAKRGQQEQLDARRKQASDAAQKQASDVAARREQEQLDIRRRQDSDAAASKQRQDQLDARRKQESDAAGRQRQQQADTRKQDEPAPRPAQEPRAKERQTTEEKKAAPPKAKDHKKDPKEEDDKGKDKKDRPDESQKV
jgi:hypothetical protein